MYIPENCLQESITWKSENKSVATVDANGKVSFVGKGTTTITRYLKKGTELGWCNYSKEQSHKIASESNKSNFNVYDTKGNIVLSYSGVCDFCEKSVELIGVKINHTKPGKSSNYCNFVTFLCVFCQFD